MSQGLSEQHQWYLGFQTWLSRQPGFADLLTLFPLRGQQLRDWPQVREAHLAMIRRVAWDEALNRKLVAAIDAYQADAYGVQPVDTTDPAVTEAAVSLARDGYVMLPDLPAETIARMRDWAAEQQVLPKDDGAGPHGPMSMASARAVSHMAHFENRASAQCPHLLDIATDPLRLGVAASWCGTRPTVLLTLLWWSFATASGPKDAQLFHLDVDDVRFCKFFIYLTDVDEEDGPHVFLPGSHRQDFLLRSKKAAENPEAYRQWLFGQLRKTDQEVGAYFDTEPVRITGKAGTNFMALTRGLHKGLKPEKNDRLVAQVVYGASPFLKMEPEPVPADPENGLPLALAQPPLDFTNRFVVRSAG